MVKAENINNEEKEISKIDLEVDLEVDLDEGVYAEVYDINLNKLDELSEVEIDLLNRLSMILDTLKL